MTVLNQPPPPSQPSMQNTFIGFNLYIDRIATTLLMSAIASAIEMGPNLSLFAFSQTRRLTKHFV
jgi:hypothetical protein